MRPLSRLSTARTTSSAHAVTGPRAQREHRLDLQHDKRARLPQDAITLWSGGVQLRSTQ
jgi:hypothetical protein